ncbi:DUF2268 domain-containing putative Zn-dependent protease [Flavobacterium silvaticum]|uniref:DUF2268 domain-containing protein n=1 Tax=Flavobacterium silvaticum TaxID=1852020 RepID=A0A972G1J9_9FLAO|nr:DUF2268 domain-containing putative Zn-dependent protease [Flavobacterium silvaticum]NMH28761.1 hypothetical protein [Flavobacterium silvaticum]
MKLLRKLLCTLVLIPGFQSFAQQFYSEDIDRFWKTYDLIRTEKDSIRQYQILKDNYISPASAGLTDLIAARNYSDAEFLTAINSYPEFWSSIRKNTLNSQKYVPQIKADFAKLKSLYPKLSVVPVYFCIGALRCNGTGNNGKILIGSEMALADDSANYNQLPEWMHAYYAKMHPLDNLSLLCTHEYIHTQQKPLLENLLCASLYEGIAEFISCLATGKESNIPAFSIWEKQKPEILTKYKEDLFLTDRLYDWMWGNNSNALKERDLGYVVGFKIAEAYYRKASDKKRAITELIELDYTNDAAVETVVDYSGLLGKSIGQLHSEYESRRPTVISVAPFGTDKTVKPGHITITLKFSQPLNGYNTGLDFGPLGEEHVIKFSKAIGWNNDFTEWSFEAELQPDFRYQLLVSNNFRLANGVRLKPFLIDIATSAR